MCIFVCVCVKETSSLHPLPLPPPHTHPHLPLPLHTLTQPPTNHTAITSIHPATTIITPHTSAASAAVRPSPNTRPVNASLVPLHSPTILEAGHVWKPSGEQDGTPSAALTSTNTLPFPATGVHKLPGCPYSPSAYTFPPPGHWNRVWTL